MTVCIVCFNFTQPQTYFTTIATALLQPVHFVKTTFQITTLHVNAIYFYCTESESTNNTYLIPLLCSLKWFSLLHSCIHFNQMANNGADAVWIGDTNPMIKLPEHTPKTFLIIIAWLIIPYSLNLNAFGCDGRWTEKKRVSHKMALCIMFIETKKKTLKKTDDP